MAWERNTAARHDEMDYKIGEMEDVAIAGECGCWWLAMRARDEMAAMGHVGTQHGELDIWGFKRRLLAAVAVRVGVFDGTCSNF